MEKDIGKINKGEYQGTVTEIVVGIKEYNGKVGVDIREFVAGEKYTGPTKKGLRIPVENFPKFKEMINSITEEDLKQEEAPVEEQQLPQGQETLEEEKVETEKPGEEGVMDCCRAPACRQARRRQAGSNGLEKNWNDACRHRPD